MKRLGITHGAQIRRVHPLGRYAGLNQLTVILVRQIEMHSSVLAELLRDLRPNLVAALTDPRSDRRMHIRGNCAKPLLHARECVLHDLCHRTAPSGMHRSHGAAALVHQEHWNTIRRLDGHDRPGEYSR